MIQYYIGIPYQEMNKIIINKKILITGIVGGLLLSILGFLYEIVFAGIPYQDPTPSMMQSYHFHQTVGQVIEWLGMVILILSIIGIIIHTSKKHNEN